MFKLFLAVLVLSDTGSIAQNTTITDFNNGQACAQLAKEANTTHRIEREGHMFTVITKGQCVGDGLPGAPPVAQFFDGINQIMRQVR